MEDARKTKKQLIEELNCLRLEQIEQTRVTSEKFTKAFLQNSIPMTITTVKEGRFFDVSDAFLRLVGLKRHEVIGHTSREAGFITEEQRAFFYNELSKNGRVENLEMEVSPKGRGYISGLFNAVMISINNEIYLLTTIQDITERKRAETVLIESEKRFSSAFEFAAIGMAIVSPEGTFLKVNSSLCNYLGYTQEELTALTFQDITHPDDLEKDLAYVHQMLAGEIETYQMEKRYFGKQGNLVWVLLSVSLIHDEQNKPRYFISQIQDITARKLAEEQALSNLQLLQIVIDHSQYLIYAKNLDGKFILASQSLAEFFNQQAPEQLLGKTSHDFLPKEIADQHRTNDLEVIARQSLISFEETANKEDGLRTFLTNKFPLMDGNGKIYAVCGTSVDVTERKRAETEKEILEAQNRQLQKAESLGNMAGAIAHYFNNQLGVVIGNLDLAMMELPEGARPHEKITTAMEASNKAAEMSGLMLTYLGQSFEKREPLDLSEFCRRIMPILRTSTPGNVFLESDLPLPGPTISANANQMQQILINLLTNAWEAIGKRRGSVHLTVKTVTTADIPAAHRFPADWKPQDNAYACLEVTDADGGIGHEDIEKLFDPFFSSKFIGRGMGLPVVLGILRTHGGAITVESEPGRGSAFRVFLPVSAEEIPLQVDKTVQPLAIERAETVLLVEDEEILRNMAAAMLKQLGFSVIEAKDGVDAVEVFRQRQDEICCVLCDLTMPRMNGWETLTALRKLAPGVSVILSSGYDKAHVMAGDHPELPQVFLGKPYKLKALGDAISQALASRKK